MFFCFCTYGSLPDAAIWSCLRTGGGGLVTSEVTYLGSQLLDKVLLHKVRNKNGHKFLVDGNLLSSMDTPDISTTPVSIEQYAAELPKLTHKQLEQISNPRILDDGQQELMGLHCKLNYLPLSAMITLAKKGKLNKKFVRLKHRLPVCMSCMFGMCHHKPWRQVCEHGSNGFCPTRIITSNGRLLNKSAHLGCNNLCRSLLRLHICSLHAWSCIGQDFTGKIFIWKECLRGRRFYNILLCRQWMICWHWISTSNKRQQSKDHILCCRGTSSKWNCWAAN